MKAVLLFILLITGFCQNEDPPLREGFWYYIEDNDYNELLVYKDRLYLIKSDGNVDFYHYSISNNTLTLSNREKTLSNKLLSVDSSHFKVQNGDGLLSAKYLFGLTRTNQLLIEKDVQEFWSRLQADFSMRRWRYQDKMKEDK